MLWECCHLSLRDVLGNSRHYDYNIVQMWYAGVFFGNCRCCNLNKQKSVHLQSCFEVSVYENRDSAANFCGY